MLRRIVVKVEGTCSSKILERGSELVNRPVPHPVNSNWAQACTSYSKQLKLGTGLCLVQSAAQTGTSSTKMQQ
jgi:hypothetical protein